jgi:hypothetical protein
MRVDTLGTAYIIREPMTQAAILARASELSVAA